MSETRFVLTDEQQKILDIKEGIHLVLAPPGSGKTELLALRVENAIKNGVRDDEIICLTFTNRAAKGMRERIELKHPNNQVMIGNIHHYCSRFLSENRLLPQNASILDEEDSDTLISELKTEIGYEGLSNSNLLKLSTCSRQAGLGFPSELLLHPDMEDAGDYEQALELCKRYIERKATYRFLDFDDLLTETFKYLSDNTKNYKLSCFNWIQVDEVQDLNPMQWAIIKKISAPNTLSVYFGDYEQAIFSFMGAQLNSLHRIKEICKSDPKNGIHNLHKNFRSPSYLLNVFTDYVKANFDSVWEKKEPITNIIEKPEKGCLGLYKVDGTIEEEANFIVEQVIPQMYGKTAIIVRYNNTADRIGQLLRERNVSHFKISGYDLFRRKSINGLMAFLSILENPYDKLSWVRLFCNFGVIGTQKEARTFVHEMMQVELAPVHLFLNRATLPLNDKQAAFLAKTDVEIINQNFLNKFRDLYSDVQFRMNIQTSLTELIEIYFNYMFEKGLIDKKSFMESEQAELDKLINHVKYFTEKDNQLTLKEKIRKYIPEYKQFKESDLFFGENNILLTTVHKAKGLEFDNVIVAEATDNTYPNWRRDNIQEDARAFYVAITRAKKRLYITYHTKFFSQWKYYEREMSSFLVAIEKHFGKTLLYIPPSLEEKDQIIGFLQKKVGERWIKNLKTSYPCFFATELLSNYYPLTEKLIDSIKCKWYWNWDALLGNKNFPLSLKLIDKYSNYWDFDKLSNDIHLPWSLELIEGSKDRWDWSILSSNTSLPWSLDLIEKYKEKWEWGNLFKLGLAGNTSLPWSLELIEKYKEKWDWERLSDNSSLPWSLELIDRYKDKWDWRWLLRQSSLPWSLELVEKYKNKWNWTQLSNNSSLPWSLELIDRYKDKWDWERLSDDFFYLGLQT